MNRKYIFFIRHDTSGLYMDVSGRWVETMKNLMIFERHADAEHYADGCYDAYVGRMSL